jgi:hypothetical protein
MLEVLSAVEGDPMEKEKLMEVLSQTGKFKFRRFTGQLAYDGNCPFCGYATVYFRKTANDGESWKCGACKRTLRSWQIPGIMEFVHELLSL